MTEFRRIVAQMDDPALGDVLKLRPSRSAAWCNARTGS
jgi:hypothetical protein